MRLSQHKLLIISFISLYILGCTTTEIPLEEPPAPIIELVKYNTDVKTIIDTNCISCHITGGQASFLPLINYTQVKVAAENGPLIARMNNLVSPMPQSGLLSLEIRAIIDKWKADGFLEN
jgi:hypothetical protein